MTPKYCRKCGQELEPYTRTLGYNPQTGDAVVQQELICPRRSTTATIDDHDRWTLRQGWFTRRWVEEVPFMG